jgi:hypothetical protein
MTIMAKNPKDYGLNVEPDAPLEYDTVRMSAITNQNLLADACQCTVSQIRELNPALLKGLAPAGYDIHVPKGSGKTVLAALDNVPESHRNSWRLHRAEPGDTLSLLARRYNTPAAMIASNNTGGGLGTGSFVVIPGAYTPEGSPARRVSRVSAAHKGTAHAAVASTHTAAPRKQPPVAAAKRAPVKAQPHKAAAATVKTAALRQPGL